MKSVREQITGRCIHFNGVMNKTCEAGVKYEDVRVDKPYKFPCLKQGGECAKCKFPTPEEVEIHFKELEEAASNSIIAWVKIKEHTAANNSETGEVDCECGGKLKYVIAPSNGHIYAKCQKCDISFNE